MKFLALLLIMRLIFESSCKLVDVTETIDSSDKIIWAIDILFNIITIMCLYKLI